MKMLRFQYASFSLAEFFFFFLLDFAVYAKRRNRSNFESGFAYLVTAEFADTKGAVLDPLQSFPDFIDQPALPVPDTEFKTAIRLLRCPIIGIRKVCIVRCHFRNRFPSLIEKLSHLFLQNTFKILTFLEIHSHLHASVKF